MTTAWLATAQLANALLPQRRVHQDAEAGGNLEGPIGKRDFVRVTNGETSPTHSFNRALLRDVEHLRRGINARHLGSRSSHENAPRPVPVPTSRMRRP